MVTGPIPPKLGTLRELRALRLDRNNLTGTGFYIDVVCSKMVITLGDEPRVCVRRTHFREHKNILKMRPSLFFPCYALAGHIPKELGALSKLQVLQLRDNKLSGEC